MSIEFTVNTGNNFAEMELLPGFQNTTINFIDSYSNPPAPIITIILTPTTIDVSFQQPNAQSSLNQPNPIDFGAELGSALSFVQFYLIGERLMVLGFNNSKTVCVQIGNFICFDIWKICQINYILNDIVFGSVLTAQNEVSFQNVFNNPEITNVVQAFRSTKEIFGSNFDDSLTTEPYHLCNGALGTASVAMITLLLFLIAAFVLGFCCWTFVYNIPVF